jgi:hypothetical protein
LAKLLPDHLDGGLGVQKEVANDLPLEFVGSAILGLGPTGLSDQGGGPSVTKGVADLKVTLAGESVLRGGLVRAESLALSFDEHEELSGDGVIGRDNQRTMFTDDGMGSEIEMHRGTSLWQADEGRADMGVSLGAGAKMSNEICPIIRQILAYIKPCLAKYRHN